MQRQADDCFCEKKQGYPLKKARHSRKCDNRHAVVDNRFAKDNDREIFIHLLVLKNGENGHGINVRNDDTKQLGPGRGRMVRSTAM